MLLPAGSTARVVYGRNLPHPACGKPRYYGHYIAVRRRAQTYPRTTRTWYASYRIRFQQRNIIVIWGERSFVLGRRKRQAC